ncbi:MAG: DEAD/DEAH box helicase family protein [Bacteroidota bacterium]
MQAPNAALPTLPGLHLQHGFQFRRGQRVFLEKLAAALQQGQMNHLGVFVPGYGKTITALASFVMAHHLRVAEKLVVFVPRGNLRDQYADAQELDQLFRNLGAPRFSFCVADSDRVFLKNLDTQIIITTYQYASGEGGNRALQRFCQTAPCLFVFDEVHHLADDGTWAKQIEQLAFACSVALSGTPMRSDNKTLFGVPFHADLEGHQFYQALHEVTMRDAHEEGGILKRVEAHIVDYSVRLVQADTGEEVQLSLSMLAEKGGTSKEIDAYLARRRLRFHDVYLDTLLAPAFAQFRTKRQALRQQRRGLRGRVPMGAPEHQMLVIAMSNRHAAAILDYIERHYPDYASTRIGQDLPGAVCQERLEDYREGVIDVMVQVDMIGEGTDIKPISVIVKTDLVRALSKTMQQVFRGMRYLHAFPEAANVCDIYAANDSDVVHVLEWITSEEQLGVRQRERRERETPVAPAEPTERSAWEVKEVQGHAIQSHRLELARGQAPGEGTLHVRKRQAAVDVNAQEKVLRKLCAELATELSYVLGVSIRQVHAQAKRRLSKAQEQLSIQELTHKRDWLERCLRSQRFV